MHFIWVFVLFDACGVHRVFLLYNLLLDFCFIPHLVFFEALLLQGVLLLDLYYFLITNLNLAEVFSVKACYFCKSVIFLSLERE